MIVNNIAHVTNETEILAQLGQPRKVTLLSSRSMSTELLSKFMRSINLTRNESKTKPRPSKLELNRRILLFMEAQLEH